MGGGGRLRRGGSYASDGVGDDDVNHDSDDGNGDGGSVRDMWRLLTNRRIAQARIWLIPHYLSPRLGGALTIEAPARRLPRGCQGGGAGSALGVPAFSPASP